MLPASSAAEGAGCPETGPGQSRLEQTRGVRCSPPAPGGPSAAESSEARASRRQDTAATPRLKQRSPRRAPKRRSGKGHRGSLALPDPRPSFP